ncbi:MAG: hypothetical protein LJE94_16545 [Deltaproteobacteria bacterium]|nr:hypothetical protein [Deltaproteobacteria bacterium]
MIEYIILSFQNFALSFQGDPQGLLLYFTLGGVVVAVLGFWMKKWTGMILGILGVLLLYLYVTGFFGRTFG